MAGGAFFAGGGGQEEYDLDDPSGAQAHAVQWVGKPGVKGPRWARMPLLTVGMLGIQCVWSIEMGYASPFLLELGLSMAWMPLVFMAGPLSGLIVQPLIGVFADRSKSRFGRRRPFMLAGVAICAFGMMTLGWARELGGKLGGARSHEDDVYAQSSPLGIAIAVWSIYLIDFSINAVMSTDRALVVDTLTAGQQEEGSAWAGRMFGFGSVVGFFVGNLDLTPWLPFLGKTQIQILSFITSLILILTHAFTSWAVTERVLLRDDRPQSKSGLLLNLKAIWDNMFTLSPGIQTVCIVQFFAFLGWFPILFFTTLWVSGIYKQNIPMPADATPESYDADAVRTGARALFLQALVNIVCSIGVPFLVAESGVMPAEQSQGYAALGFAGGDPAEGPTSAGWKRAREDSMADGRTARLLGQMATLIRRIKEEGVILPIQGLTLVRVWWISMFVFSACMAATWFVTSLTGAYIVISITGFSWAMTNWAPYSLLGELILIDGQTDQAGLETLHAHTSDDDVTLFDRPPSPSPAPRISSRLFSARQSPSSLQRHVSHSQSSDDVFRLPTKSHSPLPTRPASSLSAHKALGSSGEGGRLSLGQSLTPGGPSGTARKEKGRSKLSSAVKSQDQEPGEEEGETSLVLHHSDSSDDDIPSSRSPRSPRSPYRPPASPARSARSATGAKPKDTADKAGVILGIHNVYLVLPQFIITALASFLFWLMEPEKGSALEPVAGHPMAGPVLNGTLGVETTGDDAAVSARRIARAVVLNLIKREGAVGGEGASPDAVGLIFRVGGVASLVGGIICYRLARRWARGEP